MCVTTKIILSIKIIHDLYVCLYAPFGLLKSHDFVIVIVILCICIDAIYTSTQCVILPNHKGSTV